MLTWCQQSKALLLADIAASLCALISTSPATGIGNMSVQMLLEVVGLIQYALLEFNEDEISLQLP